MTIKAIQIQFTVTPGGLIFSFTPLKKSKDIPQNSTQSTPLTSNKHGSVKKSPANMWTSRLHPLILGAQVFASHFHWAMFISGKPTSISLVFSKGQWFPLRMACRILYPWFQSHPYHTSSQALAQQQGTFLMLLYDLDITPGEHQ